MSPTYSVWLWPPPAMEYAAALNTSRTEVHRLGPIRLHNLRSPVPGLMQADLHLACGLSAGQVDIVGSCIRPQTPDGRPTARFPDSEAQSRPLGGASHWKRHPIFVTGDEQFGAIGAIHHSHSRHAKLGEEAIFHAKP